MIEMQNVGGGRVGPRLVCDSCHQAIYGEHFLVKWRTGLHDEEDGVAPWMVVHKGVCDRVTHVPGEEVRKDFEGEPYSLSSWMDGRAFLARLFSLTVLDGDVPVPNEGTEAEVVGVFTEEMYDICNRSF